MAVSKGGPSEQRRWLAAEVMDLISVLKFLMALISILNAAVLKDGPSETIRWLLAELMAWI